MQNRSTRTDSVGHEDRKDRTCPGCTHGLSDDKQITRGAVNSREPAQQSQYLETSEFIKGSPTRVTRQSGVGRGRLSATTRTTRNVPDVKGCRTHRNGLNRRGRVGRGGRAVKGLSNTPQSQEQALGRFRCEGVVSRNEDGRCAGTVCNHAYSFSAGRPARGFLVLGSQRSGPPTGIVVHPQTPPRGACLLVT